MQEKMIEWSVAVRAREGEDLPGDHFLAWPGPDRFLLAVVDGIGHGPKAALASNLAVSTLKANANRPLISLLQNCHRALYMTRGVVMSLAIFQQHDHTMAWLGVGNVQGRLLRADQKSARPQEELLLRNGVVGHNIPATLAVNALPVASGDVLILATDGIQREFTDGIFIGRSTRRIADDILATYSDHADDALVMVAKVRDGAFP